MSESRTINPEDLEFAEAWRPKPGEHLIGTVTGVDERDGDYGAYPVITVRTETGELAWHAFHTVARNELAKLRPEVGDEIGVRYGGKDAEKGYARYRVKVRKSNASSAGVDWDAMTADAEAELPSDEDDGIASLLQEGETA